MTKPIYLVQFRAQNDRACCALLQGDMAQPAAAGQSTYDLALRATAEHLTLAEVIAQTAWSSPRPLENMTLLPPVTHPDPTHLYGTGTGLTHLGSAKTRSAMDLPGKCGEHQLRNQEVFYGKREQTDAGVSA
jgi:hypothetical protein